MKYDNIIAIDPDRDKSGVAYLQTATKKLEATSIDFPSLLDYLQFCKKKAEESGESLVIVVEAGWLVSKSNYHPYQGHRAEKISKDVGANHETGRKICEMARHFGLETVEHHPLKKCWRGRDGKITQEELHQITGIVGRMNQDARDAALLAWSYANFPISLSISQIMMNM